MKNPPLPPSHNLQFNYGHDREEDRLNESGRYRHTFVVPAAWKHRKVNIVFDGSMTDTEVRINGRSAGAIHRGAFYRFRYDIGALLKYGKENLLEECLFARSGDREKSRNRIRLSLLPSGWIEVDYACDVRGANDLIGVTFDFPEQEVNSARWLGNSPGRVWKNRLKGVTFGLWEKAYNNTVTGESWEYPEFKGFHANLYAADLSTGYGLLRIVAASEDLFLHLLTPDKPAGRTNDHTIAPFPDGALSILSAISPVGTKFKPPSELGPQSRPNMIFSSSHTDPVSGKFYLKFEPQGIEN